MENMEEGCNRYVCVQTHTTQPRDMQRQQEGNMACPHPKAIYNKGVGWEERGGGGGGAEEGGSY